MDKIRILIGIGLAVLADVAMGIIIFHLASKAFNVELPIYLYLIGVFFSLLPDADLFLVKTKIIKDHHQFPSHYPVIIVPICAAVWIVSSIFSSFPAFWTTVAGLCLLSHYCDDSWGRTSGIGLRWGMPWDKRYYSFFPYRVLTEADLEKMNLLSPEEWVGYHYLRITPELLLGVGLLLGAVLLLLFW